MEKSLAVAPISTAGRFMLHRSDRVAASNFARDVREGLTSFPKSLQPHYFYDALGSALFSAICELPEYYVTRAEEEILIGNAAEIAGAFGSPIRVVELGSGSARKTRHLLAAILPNQPRLEFLPVDIDAGILASSGHDLLNEYPGLSVTAICGDFREPGDLLRPWLPPSGQRTIVLFLGSSIGNLAPQAAAAMLANLRTALKPGDALFLGVDLRKSSDILERAYADALGVTAAFNLNVLARIDRELGGTFDLATFEHRAFYDTAEGRIEMHLVSRIAQRVLIEDYEIAFEQGESIHTENSYKYDDADLATLAAAGGFRTGNRWTDGKGYFADLLLVAT